MPRAAADATRRAPPRAGIAVTQGSAIRTWRRSAATPRARRPSARRHGRRRHDAAGCQRRLCSAARKIAGGCCRGARCAFTRARHVEARFLQDVGFRRFATGAGARQPRACFSREARLAVMARACTPIRTPSPSCRRHGKPIGLVSHGHAVLAQLERDGRRPPSRSIAPR